MRVDLTTPELQSFLAGAQAKVDANYAQHLSGTPEHLRTKLALTQGPRYIRIVADHASQRSAWGFICRETGAVLKADGWARPARGARGNIFNPDNGLGHISAYGPAYLR